ncbi:MAG TPA: cytidine deaminase [Bacteroidetes bacterium]|nr:cytidine deaminase [Bacteroidota bacterium]
MEVIRHTTELRHYSSVNELSKPHAALLAEAARVAGQAYAPYSSYQVGCAIELANGEIICGSNQENASFPAGTCAERSALFYAGSRYPGVAIVRVAVTTLFPAADPVAPCGICRQALLEYENRQDHPIELLMSHPGGRVYVSDSVANILPVFFRYKK